MPSDPHTGPIPPETAGSVAGGAVDAPETSASARAAAPPEPRFGAFIRRYANRIGAASSDAARLDAEERLAEGAPRRFSERLLLRRAAAGASAFGRAGAVWALGSTRRYMASAALVSFLGGGIGAAMALYTLDHQRAAALAPPGAVASAPAVLRFASLDRGGWVEGAGPPVSAPSPAATAPRPATLGRLDAPLAAGAVETGSIAPVRLSAARLAPKAAMDAAPPPAIAEIALAPPPPARRADTRRSDTRRRETGGQWGGEWGDAGWRRYTVPPPPEAAGRPALAIIIDDLGPSPQRNAAALAVPAPLTFGILPSPRAGALAAAALAAGKESLLHLPMEPVGSENPGPKALLTSLPLESNLKLLDEQLDSFSGYVGVNNHMGSAATADPELMLPLLKALRARDLVFVDSRTSAKSWGWRLAQELSMPWAVNQVFLDNERDREAITAQLDQAAALARRRGTAVAIGHPHGVTLSTISRWVARGGAGNVAIVPISTIIDRLAAR